MYILYIYILTYKEKYIYICTHTQPQAVIGSKANLIIPFCLKKKVSSAGDVRFNNSVRTWGSACHDRYHLIHFSRPKRAKLNKKKQEISNGVG